jgi:Mrp family chromosome partitioning ATPase
MLGIKLLYNQPDKESLVVMVSATDESGSTGAVAANLAVSLAQAGKRVILVDLESTNPVISSLFGLGEQEGVSDFLYKQAERPTAMLPVIGLPTLRVWPIGTVEIDSARLMSQRLVDTLRTFKNEADIVICAVPMIQRPDTLLMASWSDGIVLVTTKGKTDEESLRDIFANIRMVNAVVLAAVLKSGTETRLLFERQREPLVGGKLAPAPIDGLSKRAGEHGQR